ncbi:MAG TPA: PAS domain S-box protein [Opitutaceae bacterium]|nr:PAS domain S-box protein [Opitutaceae bacterium]
MMLLELVHNLALLVALAAASQVIEARWRVRRLTSQILHGLLFGTVGVLGMMTPVHFQPGIIFDGRSIILSVAGLFGGPVVALLATLMCGAYRLWLGGVGTAMGVSVVLASAALGVAFYYGRHRAARPMGWWQLWGFGLLVSGVMVGLVMLLPAGAWHAAWRQLGLPIIVFYPIATMLISLLFLDYEKQLRDRTTLAESEARFRTMMEQAADAVFLRDRAGWILDANRKACQSLGYTREELLAMKIWEIDPDAFQAGKQDLWDRVLAGEHFTFESHQKRKDGSTFPVEVTLGSVRLPLGPTVLSLVRDITDRKRVEASLEESRRMLVSVLDTIPVRVFWKDTDGRYLGCNQPFASDAGFDSPETLIGKDDYDMAWKEQADLYRADDRQVITSGVPKLQYEEPQTTPAGTQLWLRTSKIPLRDSAGRIIGILGTYEDITERKRAEQELERSAREWQTTFDATNDAIWILDQDHRVLRSNQTAERFFQRPCGEMLGQKCWAIVHDTAEPHPQCPFVRACQSRRRETAEMQQDGRWFEVTVDPILDAAGQLAGAVHIVSDITERKQAEETLRTSEEKYKRLIETTRTGYVILDQRGCVADANPEYVRLTGRQRLDDILGHSVLEWTAPHDLSRNDRAVKECLEQGSARNLEIDYVTSDGHVTPIEINATVLRLAGSVQILTLCRDVTEKKQLEAQFLRAQRLDGLGSLAGGVAHDLNNILTPILVAAPLLRSTVTDTENRNMLDTVHACAQRGADIIRQLLTFARGQPNVRVPLPVRHLLHEIEKIVSETFPRNLRLEITAPQERWLVQGDATQIQQALMNLCVNARDAMPDGGTLTLAAENIALDAEAAALVTDAKPEARPGAYVCISVTDTGTGIPREQLDRVFDPFFTTKDVGRGTGLGLSTVLGIVRGHGGFVRVDSRVGQGTRFELYLPALREAKEVGAPAPAMPPPRGHGELILVVEDEAAVLSVVQCVLEQQGYRVLAATEGAEALALLARHREEVKAVLTDMMMPGVDGPTLVHALRQNQPALPILGMSGLGDRAAGDGPEGYAAPEVLAKPFKVEALLAAVHRTLTSDTSGRSRTS